MKQQKFTTQHAIQTGMHYGIGAVEVSAAVILFLTLVVGCIAIMILDMVVGALGWSEVLKEQTFNLIGIDFGGNWLALFLEAGPDAVSSLIAGLVAAKLQRDGAIKWSWAIIIGLGFGLAIHLADGYKDFLFGQEFLNNTMAQAVSDPTRAGRLENIGAGLIGAISLFGNVALPGLLAYARMLLNKFDEEPAAPPQVAARPVQGAPQQGVPQVGGHHGAPQVQHGATPVQGPANAPQAARPWPPTEGPVRARPVQPGQPANRVPTPVTRRGGPRLPDDPR